MSDSFDLLVIGGGPGGYPAAIRGAQLGLKVACVERDKLGGVCLNWGCIPSKALLKTAELAHAIRDADRFGLSTGELSIDYAKVVERSRKVSRRFEKGVGSLFKKYGVTQIPGTATLTGPGAVTVSGADGERQLTARHVVLATGARARSFPGITPDGERILTYREAIVLTERPPSVVVLGAGAIGMEFAYFLHAMGSEVTVVEAQPEVLPLEDAEVAAEVRKAFTKSGITVKVGTRVQEVTREGDACAVTLGDGTRLDAHTVLVALGVTPNSDALGLDAVGVRTDARGFIEVDASHRTSVTGVYAVGDVCNAGPALAHVATRQAHVCVERIAGHTVPDVDPTAIPSCTYCQPQVASVGMTEAAAKAAGKDVRIGRFPFVANGRSQGSGHPEGFVKVVIDNRYGEILGAHIVGADATEMVAEFVLARSAEATAETLMTTMHAHPTAAEAMLEAVAKASGESVHI
ncbi:MAG: dihydrolipoyl dehydrogenase [Alphaproteobacteria bacterium]|nr:dihydrolipoyl dehydrogenase [Alphaproteobacteria bacterium]